MVTVSRSDGVAQHRGNFAQDAVGLVEPGLGAFQIGGEAIKGVLLFGGGGQTHGADRVGRREGVVLARGNALLQIRDFAAGTGQAAGVDGMKKGGANCHEVPQSDCSRVSKS